MTAARPRGARWALALAAVASGGLLASCSSGSPTAAGGCGPSSPTLTVQGSGVATGSPDSLTMDFSVQVVGPTAQRALADANGTTAALIAAVTQGGIARRDLQTTGLTLQPNVTLQNGSMVQSGFAAAESVIATSRDLSTAGAVVDEAVAAGGADVRIDSLSLSTAHPSRLQDEARRDAVAQAVGHAGAMAAGAGERLGMVCSVRDDTAGPVNLPYGPERSALSQGAAALPSAVPVEPGTQQATDQVTVVYALRAR